jgi:GNAT superfamily N-acetyltransferase
VTARPAVPIRPPDEGEIDQLARIWHDGWHDAHAHLMPAGLTSARTIASFAERLPRLFPDTRVTGPVGAPVGFCVLRGDELYQLYVVAAARGQGIAAALVEDAEQRLAARGVTTAWLACAIGNTRAARFYEKCGWHHARNTVLELQATGAMFAVEVWRYEKQLPR